MKLINVGAAAVNLTPLDWAGNKTSLLTAIESAREQGVTVLCLPELCLCGYGCEDAFFSAGVRRTARELLGELLPATVGMVVTFGLPVLHRNGLYDAVCVVADGRVVGYVPKQTLAGAGLHYEPRWFKPWPPDVRDVLTYDGKTYPVGDLHFELDGIKFGLEICEEAWSSGRRGLALARRGVDIILNPSASHFAFGKAAVRERFVLEGSRAFGVVYVYANLLGNEAGRVLYDGGAMIATAGRLVAVGPRFGYGAAYVTSATVDIDEVRTGRAGLAETITPPGPEADVGCIRIDLPLPALRPSPPAVVRPAWEHGKFHQEEEFTRAVGLGLMDYLRKTRSRGFIVSLSGGADSSAVASLAALGVHLGCAGLGVETFKQRFALAELAAATPEALVREILTCVYQATANSTDVTRNAARGLVRALGARYYEWDVEPLVRAYVDLMARTIGRPLTWETDDIVLQNIQARVRAPAAWMLANLTDSLLLATSNRSEAAVGYATMDGDTAGGLSPIAGIDKAFLSQWLTWLETRGPQGLAPIGALSAVNALTPTAELRPPAMGQTDEADLMPYPLLDAIEAAAIRDKNTPVEVHALMAARFPQYAPGQLVEWVDRFFALWSRNQWKRERYAPSFHVDDKNLDPKTSCRFPILSGGYQRERDHLRRQVEREK